LNAFKGCTLADISAPKLSKLQKEKLKAIEKDKGVAVKEIPKVEGEEKEGRKWEALSFEDAFTSFKPHKSLLEREKE